MHEEKKVQEEKYKELQEKNKELQEKHKEKQPKLEELEKLCKKLELQHDELFSDMTNLKAQNKDLQQLHLKMKKKHFRFFGRRTLLLLQLSLDKSSPIFLQQGRIIQ